LILHGPVHDGISFSLNAIRLNTGANALVPQAALVHFSPLVLKNAKVGAGGELFAFRYGDIMHLSPRKVETIIGPMAVGGEKGGSSVMNILERTLSESTVNKSHLYTERVLKQCSRVVRSITVQDPE
jgi:hypothetical protein